MSDRHSQNLAARMAHWSGQHRKKAFLTGCVAALAAVVVATASGAPDARPPRIVAAAMQDADGDTRADQLKLRYSERVRHPADRDGRYPFRVAGYRIRSVGAASGSTIVIRLVEQAAPSDATPSLRYRRTRSKPVRDRAGKRAAVQVVRVVRANVTARPVLPPPPPTPPPPGPPTPTDADGDGVVDTQDCAPADPKIFPGAPDLPDLSFVDSNCDGIDGTETSAVFVSPLGLDTNPGTKAAPMRSLQGAVARAAETGKQVYAAAGAYDRAELAGGVGVFGGYEPQTWARNLSLVTSIAGASEGIYAANATGVVLQHLTVRGTSTGRLGSSAYGIRLVGGSAATLQRVLVSAGPGATGAQAAPDGAIGAAGGKGGNGALGECDGKDPGRGGAGGRSPAGRIGGRGGDGGRGDNSGTAGSMGEIGTTGGKGSKGISSPAASGIPARDGQKGENGPNGTKGAGGTNSAAAAATTWQGQDGRTGTKGEPGDGGGGGGGGGGQGGILVLDGAGNGGGGGGGGAAGGGGGAGSGAGGGSFGIYLHNATVVVSQETSVKAEGGAQGANGAFGGSGGAGGDPGLGAVHCVKEIGAGGHGGPGGNGGTGGGGGGGAGGPSIGIFKGAASAALVSGATVAAGTPGPGGQAGGGGRQGDAAANGARGVGEAIFATG